MENDENIRTPQYGVRPEYNYTPGPPAGVLFHKSKLAKIGLILIILTIIGLILSYAVPWFYTNTGSESIMFGHDFKDEDGNLFGYSGYSDMYSHYFGYILGAPSMADVGFIFLLILPEKMQLVLYEVHTR